MPPPRLSQSLTPRPHHRVQSGHALHRPPPPCGHCPCGPAHSQAARPVGAPATSGASAAIAHAE
eukprot:421504-Prymnesium_polylepis.1